MFKKARQTFVEKEIAWTGSCIVHPCEIAPEAEQETEGTVTDIRSKANGAGVHGGAVRGDTRGGGGGGGGGSWGARGASTGNCSSYCGFGHGLVRKTA